MIAPSTSTGSQFVLGLDGVFSSCFPTNEPNKNAGNQLYMTSTAPAPADQTPGPGHSPTRPHPTPNSTDPNNSGASISVRFGIQDQSVPHHVVCFIRYRCHKYPRALTGTADPSTVRSVGSYDAVTLLRNNGFKSKKPCTLLVFDMPEMANPIANMAPLIAAPYDLR